MKDRSQSAHSALEQQLGLMDSHIVHIDQPTVDFRSAGPFREALNKDRNSASNTVIVDLEQVSYLGEEGLHTLLKLQRELQKQGGQVILLDIKPDSQVSEAIEMKGFSEIFRQEASAKS